MCSEWKGDISYEHIDSDGVMMHTGLNPNYTAATYIDPQKDRGVLLRRGSL